MAVQAGDTVRWRVPGYKRIERRKQAGKLAANIPVVHTIEVRPDARCQCRDQYGTTHGVRRGSRRDKQAMQGTADGCCARDAWKKRRGTGSLRGHLTALQAITRTYEDL